MKKIELITVLKELHQISGFRLSIYDTNMHEIAAYPHNLSQFCSLMQQNKDVRNCCIQNDADAFDVVKNKQDIHIYHCRFGLYEAVAPLYHFGVLSGYLMMGQTLDTKKESKSFVFSEASKYIEDKTLLEQVINQIPTSSKDKILSCISLMNICAEYISLSNRLALTDKNLAHEIKKYINQNFASKITLEALSSHFFYSKTTIMNAFKNIYHISINQYLRDVRLNHALKLLDHSDYSIRFVSEQCGFSDQNYFSRVFSMVYGVTPSQYQMNSMTAVAKSSGR
jgi:AraC-like DNA-binding protein